MVFGVWFLFCSQEKENEFGEGRRLKSRHDSTNDAVTSNKNSSRKFEQIKIRTPF